MKPVAETCTDTDGVIHGINPLQGEHTLCGNAFDGDSDGLAAWEPNKTMKKVTCEMCIQVIEACRQMKTI